MYILLFYSLKVNKKRNKVIIVCPTIDIIKQHQAECENLNIPAVGLCSETFVKSEHMTGWSKLIPVISKMLNIAYICICKKDLTTACYTDAFYGFVYFFSV